MSTESEAERLARAWIDRWNAGDPDSIPLAGSFVHVSPFGRIEGRENFLELVKPAAKRNVTSMTVLRVLADANEAVIAYQKQTPKGIAEACDWVFTDGELITEIRSYYDPIELRD